MIMDKEKMVYWYIGFHYIVENVISLNYWWMDRNETMYCFFIRCYKKKYIKYIVDNFILSESLTVDRKEWCNVIML